MLELKYQRLVREWSQAELSKRACIPRSYISMIESRRLFPYDKYLERLASAFDVDDPSVLLEEHQERAEKTGSNPLATVDYRPWVV